MVYLEEKADPIPKPERPRVLIISKNKENRIKRKGK